MGDNDVSEGIDLALNQADPTPELSACVCTKVGAWNGEHEWRTSSSVLWRKQ